VTERVCQHCGRPGVRQLYYSSRCRKRAFRRRIAGVSESAFVEGAQQGRLSLHDRALALEVLTAARR
jgi:hypothetical protein